jgi:hypothetical protein
MLNILSALRTLLRGRAAAAPVAVALAAGVASAAPAPPEQVQPAAAGQPARAGKKFHLRADQIKPLAQGFGGCIASDRIVVDGARVGYMYRGSPVNPKDSGWRFVAGDEDEAYMANNAHHDVYDVNTIANYDPEIIPLLKAPTGSAFERVGGRLVPAPPVAE